MYDLKLNFETCHLIEPGNTGVDIIRYVTSRFSNIRYIMTILYTFNFKMCRYIWRSYELLCRKRFHYNVKRTEAKRARTCTSIDRAIEWSRNSSTTVRTLLFFRKGAPGPLVTLRCSTRKFACEVEPRVSRAYVFTYKTRIDTRMHTYGRHDGHRWFIGRHFFRRFLLRFDPFAHTF